MNKLWMIPVLFILLAINVNAQPNKEKPKLTPPKMESFWGNIKGGKLTVNDIHRLVDSSVTVITDKKEKLKISRAIFIYRSKDYAEDEKTGEVKIRYNSTAYNFRNTDQLTAQWKRTLRENIKPGDQIVIADIIVRDSKDQIFNAGDIRIIVE
jgi:hypothetical protein